MGVEMKKTSWSPIQNSKGLATIEGITLLIVFVIMVSYSLGFFGVIHSGIKNSIAARNLAFETFRNRANLDYWRDNRPEGLHFKSKGQRNHGINTELAEGATGEDTSYLATSRDIAFIRNPDYQRRVSQGSAPRQGKETDEASPVFVKIKYGICLNSGCGGGN